MKMGKVLVVANQKGGVGKTTTAVNLASSLANLGQRVLLLDMDSQGNASVGSGIRIGEDESSMREVLLGEQNISESIKITNFGYHLLPSNVQLAEAEFSLINQPDREYKLRHLLTPIINNYHYLIIDCPPSLSLLTVNSLVAADDVIIPVQCEYYALEGLVAMSKIIQSLNKFNTKLAIAGMLRTMYNARSRLALEVSRQLIAHFGELVYHTIIPRNVKLAEAPGEKQPALFYDRSSVGAQAYLNLARELLKQQEENG